MNVKYSVCNSNTLDNIVIENGQLIYVIDTQKQYMDVNDTRIEMGDVINISTLPATGITGKLYFNTSTNTLCFYNGSSFVSLYEYDDTEIKEQLSEIETEVQEKPTLIEYAQGNTYTAGQMVYYNQSDYTTLMGIVLQNFTSDTTSSDIAESFTLDNESGYISIISTGVLTQEEYETAVATTEAILGTTN